MERILANESNVEKLFERSEMDYAYRETDGPEMKTCKVMAWKCRACGWKSLLGIRDLPFAHECRGFVDAAAATGVTGLAGGVTTY